MVQNFFRVDLIQHVVVIIRILIFVLGIVSADAHDHEDDLQAPIPEAFNLKFE